jgi:hypothetical protein
VALVGAAAASNHVEPGQRRAQPAVSLAKIGGVAIIQGGRFVQLGMAFRGSVGAQAADAARPRRGAPSASAASKCVGWAQLIM